MHKAMVGAILGGLTGGGGAYLLARRSDEPTVDPAVVATAGALVGAALGGTAGLGMHWRDRAHRAVDTVRRLTAMPGQVVALSVDGAASALPHVEELVERASGSVFEMADAVRPHVQTLAGIAQEKAFDLAEAAIASTRPEVEVVRYRALAS